MIRIKDLKTQEYGNQHQCYQQKLQLYQKHSTGSVTPLKSTIFSTLPDNCDDSELMNLLYPTIATPTARKQEPDYEYIHRELGKPHVNLRLLWTEYKEIVPDGLEYSHSVTGIAMGSKTKAIMHITQTWVDWAGSTMQVIDRDSGEILTAYLFVASLGTSGYPYVEAFQNQKLESWIMAHVHALSIMEVFPVFLFLIILKQVSKSHAIMIL